MRVMLLKGQSAYDALRVFIDSLADAFAAQGHDVTVLDLMDGADPVGRIEAESLRQPVDLVFSFNIFGEVRDAQGRSVSQIVNAPHVIQQVDYPLTHLGKLEGTAASTAMLVIDRSHVDLVRSIYRPERFTHVSFSPHAAIGDAPQIDADPTVFAERRPIPILFSGTFYKPSKRWSEMQPNVRAIFEAAAEIALAAEWMPALDALDQALTAKGLDITEPGIAPFRKLATYVHEYVRAHRRVEFMKAAAKVGLPMHVYGRGYDQDLYRFKNVTFGGEADLPTVVGLMKTSRVVLNINANFGAGSHERPFTALLAGAAAASDYSSFYADNFEEGGEMLFYRWKSLHADLEKIGEVAQNPELVFQIARAGQRRVVEEHLWANRVPAIIAAAEAVRA